MSSHLTRIEIYVNEDKSYSYGCPDLDLMGYSDIKELIKDIKIKMSIETNNKKGIKKLKQPTAERLVEEAKQEPGIQ